MYNQYLYIMKYPISFLIFFISFQSSIVAQQTDDNTFAINNYFQIESEKPVAKTRPLQNSNIGSYVNTVQIGNENTIYIKSLQSGDSQAVNQSGNQNNYEY